MSEQGSGPDEMAPHSARIWNHWPGGKDNYEADRAMGDEIIRYFPEIVANARGNRYFLTRAVRFLVGEAGIRQFRDIGTGLPTVDNTHEIARRAAPGSRIVHADNDPLVLTHARASSPAAPKAPPTVSTPMCATPTRCWNRRPGHWTSAAPWR